MIAHAQPRDLDCCDRARTGLAEEPEADEQAIEEVTGPEAEQLAQPKRSRRKQVTGVPG